MKKLSARRLASAAVLAALYAALTMFLAPISYGGAQCRISEALCVLPFFEPLLAWGLFVGCLIANLLSPVGIVDVVFGSLATLLACLSVARLGRSYRETKQGLSWRLCVLSCLMPVLFNGLVIGAELAWLFPLDEGFILSFAVFGAQVAIGEAAAMFALGLPLLRVLPKSGILERINI